MDLRDKKIAFLGDSITEGIGADNNYGYVDYVREYTGADCTNFGISGTRIAKQKNPTVECPSFDLDFCRRAGRMDGEFDVIVVFGGTNDYGHGDADFGIRSNRTNETFYGALHTLYNTLKNTHPKAKIVIVTPIIRTDDEQLSIIKGRHLKDYVLAIKEVALFYDLPVLDIFEEGGNPVIAPSLLADGVHPNNDGHKLIARYIIDFLENNL